MTTFSGRLTNVGGNRTPVAGGFQWANFAGSGITVTITSPDETLGISAGPQEPDTITTGFSPPVTANIVASFSSPVRLRSIGFTDLDGPGENNGGFVPAISGVYGQKVVVAPNTVHDSVASNGTGGVTFNTTNPAVSALNFTVSRPGGAGSFFTELAFDTGPAPTPIPCNCCPLDELGTKFWNDGVNSGVAIPFLCCTPVVGATYEVDWSYAHRARAGTGVNTLQLRVGDAANPLGTNPIVDTDANSNTAAWTHRSGTLAIGTGFPQIRFEFIPVLPGGGAGNFIDSCSVILRRVTPTPFNFGEQLINGGFEVPVTAAAITFPVAQATVPGWRTTEPCNCYEYWRAASGVPPHSGNQFAELNVFTNGTVYQNATLETCENVVTYFDAVTGNPVAPGSIIP